MDDALWARLAPVLAVDKPRMKPGRPRAQGYVPHIPPKVSAAQPVPLPGDPTRHPPRRWVVEVAPARFNCFRRLLIRW